MMRFHELITSEIPTHILQGPTRVTTPQVPVVDELNHLLALRCPVPVSTLYLLISWDWNRVGYLEQTDFETFAGTTWTWLIAVLDRVGGTDDSNVSEPDCNVFCSVTRVFDVLMGSFWGLTGRIVVMEVGVFGVPCVLITNSEPVIVIVLRVAGDVEVRVWANDYINVFDVTHIDAAWVIETSM